MRNAKTPDLGPGFLFADHRRAVPSGRRRLGRGKGRHARGELIEPGDQARMILAPRSLETEITIPERAGERDLPDIRHGIERGWRRFERGQSACHLSHLMIDPFWLVPLGWTKAAFVDHQ